MKAIQIERPDQTVLVDIQIPKLKDNEILVKVMASGIYFYRIKIDTGLMEIKKMIYLM